jgi:hypothetical protein
VAQTGSALAWGASGRRFKSGHPDHFNFFGHVTRRKFGDATFLINLHGSTCGYTVWGSAIPNSYEGVNFDFAFVPRYATA